MIFIQNLFLPKILFPYTMTIPSEAEYFGLIAEHYSGPPMTYAKPNEFGYVIITDLIKRI